jgi:hypothetical protein
MCFMHPSMYVRICIQYMHIYICMYICIYMCVYVYVCVYTCVYVHICIKHKGDSRTHIHIHTSGCLQGVDGAVYRAHDGHTHRERQSGVHHVALRHVPSGLGQNAGIHVCMFTYSHVYIHTTCVKALGEKPPDPHEHVFSRVLT